MQCYVWFTGFEFRASAFNKTRALFRSQKDHMYTLDLHVMQIAPRKVHAYSKPKPTAYQLPEAVSRKPGFAAKGASFVAKPHNGLGFRE